MLSMQLHLKVTVKALRINDDSSGGAAPLIYHLVLMRSMHYCLEEKSAILDTYETLSIAHVDITPNCQLTSLTSRKHILWAQFQNGR